MLILNDATDILDLDSVPRTPSAGTRRWYAIEAKADQQDADVSVYDSIGGWYDGVSAKQFVADLAALPPSVKNIRVHVNSPGGEVFDAIAIANALRDHPATKEVLIEGLAASAATIITQGAGGKVSISDNAVVMIHSPYALAMGTAKDLRTYAEALDRGQNAIIATYQRKSKLSSDELATMMADTTWMDADEAVANGFADAKVEGLQAAASIDPRGVKGLSVPEKFAARVATLVASATEPEPAPAADPAPALDPAPAPATAEEVLALCKGAGLDLAAASDIFNRRVPLDAARQAVASEKARKSEEASRVSAVNAICKKFGVEDLAAGYVVSGMTADQVKAHVAIVRAREDRAANVDAALVPGGGPKVKSSLSPGEIYSQRNKLH